MRKKLYSKAFAGQLLTLALAIYRQLEAKQLNCELFKVGFNLLNEVILNKSKNWAPSGYPREWSGRTGNI